MKKIVSLFLVLILCFALTSCSSAKKEAYNEFTGLVNAGKLTEAQEYWNTECEEIFGDDEYEDIQDYNLYVSGVADYKAGVPVRFSDKMWTLSLISSDFLDTKAILEEMDDLLENMDCEFVDPTEVYYDNTAKLKFKGEDFSFYLGSHGDEGPVSWAVNYGKIVYGTGAGENFLYTFTFTEEGVEVTSDNKLALYKGTYYKED